MDGESNSVDIRLLVVEDDSALREEIRRVLERRTSYEFDTAEHAEAAIELFRQRPYDLVITDVRMPGMSGIDMLEELKQLDPDLVSVIITAFADESATIKALKIGANDYIRKPFSIRDLLAAIQRQATIIALRRGSAKQQRFLEGMVKNLVSGVLAINVDGTIVAINEKACEALSVADKDRENLENLEDIRSFSNAETAVLFSLLDELEQSGAQHLERDQKVIQSGLEIPYRLSALTLNSQKGERLGTVILFNDISTVVQQQKLSAWKDLARTVAHEIKNPLTPIILGAQQLKSARQRDTETLLNQFDKAIENIIRNAERLDNLAREFSRFGRLPNKKRTPQRLTPLVDSALSTFRQKLTRQGVEATFKDETKHDVIRGDSESLLRMLENLIGNACDAMDGGGRLEIRLSPGEEGWLELSIRDTGCGIEPELMDSLFKPYVTSKEGGTGLGLVVVKEVVDRHDGHIEVSSDENGAEFRVSFPIAREPEDDSA